MNKTAIEWLEEILSEGLMSPQYAFKKAKELEREQIIEAHGNKQRTKSNPNSIVTYGYTYTGDMYYNDKFKS